MSTSFRVLGTVEATVEGRVVHLGGRQQRRLLAVFVSEIGRHLSLDRLAEIHFPDDPDGDSSRASVRTYVSRLRSVIGDAKIATRDLGYVLVAGSGETDAAMFEAMLGAAGRAAPLDAIGLYDSALALWSGPAYGEFGSEWWALPEVARLEELRLVAHERRIDAIVAVDGDVVADLERLVLAHPLRERFVAQLMAALDRDGRQADALRAYTSFRSRLIEASGTEPSAPTVELARAISAGEAIPVAGRRHRGYEFGALIGRGATGEVFRSKQPGVGREVAVKAIRRDLASDPAFIRRFEAEAQRLARIEHPHVVPLYDFWRDATGAYLVFRYVKGGSIERSIVAGGAWPIDQVDRLVHDIGGALFAAHATGIAHGDISTTNILKDETGNLYLSDFGISTDADEASYDEAVRADVAALAKVAVDVLVGGHPSAGETSTLTSDELASTLIERRTDVPEALIGVLQRAAQPRTAPHDGPPISPAAYDSVAEFLVGWRTALPRSAVATTQEIGPHDDAAVALAEHERQRVNPYKGLRAFRESDAAEFFGRDRAVAELTEALGDQRFVVLVGSSGCGKSSLVHAGLMPVLRSRPDTYAVSFTPGTDPTQHLLEAIGELAVAGPEADGDGDSGGDGAEETSADRIARRVRSAVARAPEGDLIVVVDQIEEIWTLCGDEPRTDFLGHLTALLDDSADRVRVLVSLRADFFDRLLNEPLIGWRARTGTIGVTPMSATELHEAIVKPAAQVGVTIEDRLVTRIVSELGHGTSGLPLMQFALSELYERRSTPMIGEADYAAIGGIGGALARTAEAMFESLDGAAQHDVVELFTRLVVVGEDHQALLRRPLRLGAASAVDASLIDAWANARLLAFDHDPMTREPMVEVAHEALFEQWPRLRDWIHSERAWIQVRSALSDAATDWERSQREPADLYHGSRLERALEMADQHPGALTLAEREFLDAAVERRDREANRTRRENRRLRRLVAAVGIALAIALVAGAVAAVQRRAARDEAHRAETSRLMASAGSAAVTDTPVAALLALEARRRGDADEAQWATVAQRVLTAKPHFLGSFPTVGEYVLNPDASIMLARTAYGLEAYSTDDHTLLARVDHPTVRGIGGRRLAVSDDGVAIETAGDDEIWRYRLPELQPIGDPIRTPGSVRAVAMSPTGVMASAHPGGLIVFWDRLTGQELRRFVVPGEVFRIDLSDDGARLAVATPDQTNVYGVSDLKRVGPPLVGTDVDVSISPNGTRVAIPHPFTTDIIDVASGVLLSSVTFGAGSRWLDDDRVVVSTGLQLEVFDAVTGTKQFDVTTTCGCDLDISSDGQTALTGLDAPALYALDGRELLADPIVATPESRDGIDRVTVSATGRTMAVAQAFGGALVYRREGDDWTEVREFGAPASAIVIDDSRLLVMPGDAPVADIVDIGSGEVAWSVELGPDTGFWVDVDPNRRWIAFQTFDGTAVVRDYRTGAVVAELPELARLLEGNDAPFIRFSMGPSFSPDGSRMAASTWSGAAVGWRTDTWEATRLRYAGADVNSASRPVFDPTGRYVAVSAGRRAMSLFDATTFEHVRDLPLPVQGLPMSAAFNADGTRLAVILDTAIAIVLDVDTGSQIGAALRANFLGALHFLPDGTLAVSDRLTDNVLIWNTDPDYMQSRLCAVAGRNLTRDEWDDVGPSGEPYRRTCPQFDEPPADPTLSRDLPPL